MRTVFTLPRYPAGTPTIDAVTSYTVVRPAQRTAFARYRQSLWLLTKRDLSVRYTTNFLGYIWSILDPLLMAFIYYFVFVIVFHRGDKAGESPYMVFLLTGLLPWTWFNGVVTEATRAFSREAKLIRSTSIPRSLWVNRVVLSKGIEFLLSLPVLLFFIVLSRPNIIWGNLWYVLVGIAIEGVLCVGVGLIVAPLVVFFKDLERAIRLVLRLLFYASTVMYTIDDMPKHYLGVIELNPLVGIFASYRAAFFGWPNVGGTVVAPWDPILKSALGAVVLLVIGLLVFRKAVPSVLKEM